MRGAIAATKRTGKPERCKAGKTGKARATVWRVPAGERERPAGNDANHNGRRHHEKT